VNISCEDVAVHGSSVSATAGDLQQHDNGDTTAAAAAAAAIGSSGFVNDDAALSHGVAMTMRAAATNNGDDDDLDDRKPAAKPTRAAANNTNNDSDDDDYDDLDRKPAAKLGSNNSGAASVTDNPNTTNTNNTTTNKDQRFVCAICLETVSNEPVVTRCGHLYCWPCLYQWLQPGMLLGEYTAAFGRGSMTPPNNNNNSNNSSSSHGHGGGLNFLSEMTTSYNQSVIDNSSYQQQQADRPYNPAGGPYNEQRRCCPVCKAACTVDSVIAIYIHVHSSIDDDVHSSPMGTPPSNNGNDGNSLLPRNTSNNNRSMDSIDSLELEDESRRKSPPIVAAAVTPHYGSPAATAVANNDTDSPLDDPTNVNLGLRQRRRNRDTSNSSANDQQPFVCDTPTRNNASSNHSANNNVDDDINNNVNPSNNTPVHRNGSGDVRDRHATTTANVPSRPIPTSPWVATTSRSNDQQRPNNTSQPDLNNEQTSTSSQPISSSSSPFRLALRPRHQSHTMAVTPQRSGSDMAYSQAYTNNHHRHGRLTSALLGIVDSIDNLGQLPPSSSSSLGVGVPPLHRSDGGLGGIGRASEQHDGPRDGNGDGMMRQEESSLVMAREFLSRLLLMLACFVILCLLLF